MERIIPIEREKAKEVLLEFLRYPLNDGLEILQRFSALPGAVFSQGERRPDRFVYVPGTLRRPVLLIAHVDTVWDKGFPWTRERAELIVGEDTIVSGDPKVGIGADDRAGCALLWLLRESGHSLLLLDGEELGAFGTKYLIKNHPDLYKELNCHAYMVELDLPGEQLCHYCELPVTGRFRNYIEKSFHRKPVTKCCRTDVCCLSRQICGVNLSIGGEKEHTPHEVLRISPWLNTYENLCEVLSRKQPSFSTSFSIRAWRFIKRKYMKLTQSLKMPKDKEMS